MSFPASIFNFAPVIALIIQENYMSITLVSWCLSPKKNKTHPWHLAQKSWVEPASALAISSLALIFNFCSNAWTGATIYQFGCLNLETPVITFAQMVVATNFGVQLDSKKHMGCHETLWRSGDFGGDFLSTNLQVWNHHQNDWTAIRAPTLFLGSSWE